MWSGVGVMFETAWGAFWRLHDNSPWYWRQSVSPIRDMVDGRGRHVGEQFREPLHLGPNALYLIPNCSYIFRDKVSLQAG